MAEWNGTDLIENGHRLAVRFTPQNRLYPRVKVLFISEAFFVGLDEENNAEIGYPIGKVSFETLKTEQDMVIEDMSRVVGSTASPYVNAYKKLYDAGYRRTQGE